MLRMSCTLNPWPDIADQARRAEDLGYERVWVNDSPNVMPDVWMVLASIAEVTEVIGLGPAVIVPSLRHVVVTASAISTLERLAPTRVAVAVGTGNTGRRLLGQEPEKWSAVATYVRQLRELLSGDLVEVNGALTRMLHAPGMVANPLVVPPILIAAMGPLGLRHAAQLGDGVFRINTPVEGFGWCTVTVTGTVLDLDEDFGSPRVLRDAGPGVALAVHGMHDSPGGELKVAQVPGGAEWLGEIARLPEDTRHLAVHQGHFTSTAGLDSLLVSPEAVERLTFSGHDEQLRARLVALERAGATEIAFHPTGADTARELEAFARVIRSLNA